MRLKGKTALVTAAGQGIGHASVLALAAEGAQVWATDVNAQLLERYAGVPNVTAARLDVLDKAWPEDKEDPITFVVVPEYVARHWWERILYNQSANRLRSALLGRPHTVVVNVPYRREEEEKPDKHSAEDTPAE